MSEEHPIESQPALPHRTSGGGRRRGRRGGRGRRGPRRPAPAASAEPPAHAEGHAEEEAAPVAEAVAPAPKTVTPVEKVESPAPPEIETAAPRRAGGSGPSAISEAVVDVRRIVESLEQALEQMEEVLDLVEVAERQKFGDEREIASLRRALHRFNPPPRERREHEGDK